jgi:hypothetical protein
MLFLNASDVVPSVSDDDARKRFPGFVARKPYLRVVPQPEI